MDFTILESHTLNKIGFEISPWSTHGKLTKTKGKTQKAINEEARNNFEKDITKIRDYFKKFGIYTLIYSDTDLSDLQGIFDDMRKYLQPKAVETKMKYHVFEEILSSNI